MGRKIVSADQVEAVLAHFREHGAPVRPGDFSDAAEAAGVDRRTVMRIWSRPPRVGQKALKDRLAEEQVLARAKLQTESLKAAMEVAPLLARDDAAAQIAREVLLSRVAREVVVGALGNVAPLVKVVNKLAQDVATAATESMGPEEKLRVIRNVAGFVRDLVGAANTCIELERRRAGEPTEVVRVEVETAPTSVEEVAATVEAARRALARVVESDEAPDDPGSEAQ